MGFTDIKTFGGKKSDNSSSARKTKQNISIVLKDPVMTFFKAKYFLSKQF